MTFSPDNTQSSYVGSSQFFPEDDEQLRIKLSEMYSHLASSLNIKEIALYEVFEQPNGQQFYDLTDIQNKRCGFRCVFPFGAIAPGAGLNITHGLTGVVQYTYIGGTCKTTIDNRPIPYVSVSNITDQIGVRVTATQLIVFNGATSSPITSGYITLEYLKN